MDKIFKRDFPNFVPGNLGFPNVRDVSVGH
jgi:hypothetical protein